MHLGHRSLLAQARRSDPDAGVQEVLWKNRSSANRVTHEPPHPAISHHSVDSG